MKLIDIFLILICMFFAFILFFKFNKAEDSKKKANHVRESVLETSEEKETRLALQLEALQFINGSEDEKQEYEYFVILGKN